MQRLGLLTLVLFLTIGVSTSLSDEKITVLVEAIDDDSSQAVNYISDALRALKDVEVVSGESQPVFKLKVVTLPMIDQKDGSVMAHIVSSVALRRYDALDKYLEADLPEQDRITAISFSYSFIRNYLSYCPPNGLQQVCEEQVILFSREYLAMERQFRRQRLNARERSDDFIKLDVPLAEVLTKVTFEFTVLSGDFKEEVVFDSTYQTDDGYVLLPQYAVEGNRYIFVPYYETGGGSGVFYSLAVVDKETLRGIDEVGFGDRSMLIDVTLVPAASDVVSLTYIWRDPSKRNMYDPNATIEKHFHVVGGILRERSPEE